MFLTRNSTILFLALSILASCQDKTTPTKKEVQKDGLATLQPKYITETVRHDTDDPAIWVNKTAPDQSLVLGTDKEEGGAIFAFDLKGKIVGTVDSLDRPNNVDIEYGLTWGDSTIDIAVIAERYQHRVRVISLPDMRYIDGGGLPVFDGEQDEEFKSPMGIAVFKNPSTNDISMFVGRKNGPTDGTYIWQYSLQEKDGVVQHTLVRKLGDFIGTGEIEAIMVDDELGTVYYSDEAYGVREYDASQIGEQKQLSSFGRTGFKEDREGIALLRLNDFKGYISVSDQQNNSFQFFPRGKALKDRAAVVNIPFSTQESDGSEIVTDSLNADFPNGIMVAMSEGKVFHYYDLGEILNILSSAEKAKK